MKIKRRRYVDNVLLCSAKGELLIILGEVISGPQRDSVDRPTCYFNSYFVCNFSDYVTSALLMPYVDRENKSSILKIIKIKEE